VAYFEVSGPHVFFYHTMLLLWFNGCIIAFTGKSRLRAAPNDKCSPTTNN